ncbi:MAG: hypothetical protein IPK68_04130 [Bdellovibrionales bacterium]|nr:hypothetical protein [Bdellovibrionales bacterium]
MDFRNANDPFVLSGSSPPEEISLQRESARVAEIKLLVLDCLKNDPSPMLEKELLAKVTGRRQYKILAFQGLLNEEKIARTGLGQRGSPFLYSIVENSDVGTTSLSSGVSAGQSVSIGNEIIEPESMSDAEFGNVVQLFELL